MKTRFLIGIDPGKKTGFSLWDRSSKSLLMARTTTIVEAMEEIRQLAQSGEKIEIWFEDARLRGGSKYKAFGAGSVCRDCSIWQEFCELHGILFTPISPRTKGAKWNSAYFKKVTGWVGRTSEHARDAASLVFGA